MVTSAPAWLEMMSMMPNRRKSRRRQELREVVAELVVARGRPARHRIRDPCAHGASPTSIRCIVRITSPSSLTPTRITSAAPRACADLRDALGLAAAPDDRLHRGGRRTPRAPGPGRARGARSACRAPRATRLAIPVQRRRAGAVLEHDHLALGIGVGVHGRGERRRDDATRRRSASDLTALRTRRRPRPA